MLIGDFIDNEASKGLHVSAEGFKGKRNCESSDLIFSKTFICLWIVDHNIYLSYLVGLIVDAQNLKIWSLIGMDTVLST